MDKTIEKIQEAMSSEKLAKKLMYLYDRWQDEKKYEDFKDYVKAMDEATDLTVIKGMQRPFGFHTVVDNRKFRIYLKLTKNSFALVGDEV